MRNIKHPILAVDGLISKQDKVLLVKRAIKPFKGFWVLPGGHVNYNERVEQAVTREVKQELRIKTTIRKLLGVYSDPERDPRYHSVSIAFWLRHQGGEISLNEEASDYNFFHLEKLPRKVGFDHRKIIGDFKNQLSQI